MQTLGIPRGGLKGSQLKRFGERGEKAERPVLTALLPAAGLGGMLCYRRRWLRVTGLLICVQTQPTWPSRAGSPAGA